MIYWDRRVLHAGDPVGPAVPARRAPFDCTLVFVDLMPDRNWAHPVLYLFVDLDTGRCEIEQDSFPPYLDEQPETFVVLMQHGVEPPG